MYELNFFFRWIKLYLVIGYRNFKIVHLIPIEYVSIKSYGTPNSSKSNKNIHLHKPKHTVYVCVWIYQKGRWMITFPVFQIWKSVNHDP